MKDIKKLIQAKGIIHSNDTPILDEPDEIIIHWKNGEVHIVDGQIAIIHMYSFSYVPLDYPKPQPIRITCESGDSDGSIDVSNDSSWKIVDKNGEEVEL